MSVKSLSICYSDSSSDSEEEFNNFEVKSLQKEDNSRTNSEAEIIKEDSEKKPTISKEESQLKKVPKKRKKESSTIQVKTSKKKQVLTLTIIGWLKSWMLGSKNNCEFHAEL